MPQRGNFRALLPSPQNGCCPCLRDGPTFRHPHPRQVHPSVNVIWCFDLENLSRNPGTVEELHARWKEMLPQPFEGAKLLVQKGLSNNFQVHFNMFWSNEFIRQKDESNFCITGVTCAYNVQQYAQWVQVNCSLHFASFFETSLSDLELPMSEPPKSSACRYLE